jgi:hypothetical protein
MMREDPYFTALAFIGLVGVLGDAVLEVAQRIPFVADLYFGAGIGLLVAKHLVVRRESRNGEMPPHRVRLYERRGALIGCAAGGTLSVAVNLAVALL